MNIIHVRNVNDALKEGLRFLLEEGIEEPSRNGPVLVAPGPVCTVYERPEERVLFSPLRDANPFFHFMESMWMLAGRDDLAFVKQFNSRFGEYSDDGISLRGAYGYRWRNWFGYDQLQPLIYELRTTPNTRRAVLAMWDATESPDTQIGSGDLLATTVDKPCNTHIYFDVRGGRLNMTVCCRSNDIYWGAYGANAVHMSFLQEFMATQVNVPMGVYRQFSNNYHIYTDVVSREKMRELIKEEHSLYAPNLYLMAPATQHNLDRYFLTGEFIDSMDYTSLVMKPMLEAYELRKKDPMLAMLKCGDIFSPDWALVCKNWIQRRIK